MAIAIPGPSMDQAWPGMELPWTIHGHGWNAMESQYGWQLIDIVLGEVCGFTVLLRAVRQYDCKQCVVVL